ncbi:MAG TPA: hypothetical protein VFY65_10395 [Longimicrobium sp.]|nr:hypothetical protein [Longimicrobium sp.]
MRRTLLTAALAIPLLSACASGGLKPRYDRVAGQTNLSQVVLESNTGMMETGTEMVVTARYSWRGQGTPSPAPYAWLSFSLRPSLAAGWQWLNNNQLQLLVDGEQRATYNGRYTSDIQTSSLYENVTYQIPITDLQVMANATRIEGRVGGREVTMDADELTRQREFVTYISGGSQ